MDNSIVLASSVAMAWTTPAPALVAVTIVECKYSARNVHFNNIMIACREVGMIWMPDLRLRMYESAMEQVTAIHHYLEIAAPYLERYGYMAVLAGVMVESFGIPAPGQSLVISGALLASQGEMNITVLLLTAWSAAVVGDNIGYAIGHFGGRRLVLRHGRYVGVRADHLERVERFFQRYGGVVVVVARFFEILRQLNGVVAGTVGMTWWRFLTFNAVGATLWVGLWGWGVFYLGGHMDQVHTVFKSFEPYVVTVGVLALVGLVIYLFWRRTNVSRR
jgi:membrane protein DedA with SNARE-associated domain